MFAVNYKWLIVGALLVICSSANASNSAEGIDDNRSARLRFAMNPFEKPISDSSSLGNLKEQILQRFGEPIEKSVSTYETRFIDQTRTSFGFKYADVQFVVAQTNDGPHMFMERIEIIGNTHVLKYGVQIGTSRTQVVSLFSPMEPYATSNPMLVAVPTMETQSDFEKTGGAVAGYVPTFDITFEFDEKDCLSKISIFIAADE